MKRVLFGIWLVVSAMFTVLGVVSIVHDMSDGKADGVQYVNGCDDR